MSTKPSEVPTHQMQFSFLICATKKKEEEKKEGVHRPTTSLIGQCHRLIVLPRSNYTLLCSCNQSINQSRANNVQPLGKAEVTLSHDNTRVAAHREKRNWDCFLLLVFSSFLVCFVLWLQRECMCAIICRKEWDFHCRALLI